jgi:hypothetical protein
MEFDGNAGGRGGEQASFLLSRVPPRTNQGAGPPNSEFGWWGGAGVPASALARLLALRAAPFSPSSGDNYVNNRCMVSLRGRETWLFITLPDFYASA